MISSSSARERLRLFVLVLVARQSLGLKSVLASRIEAAVPEHLEGVPIDVIFERAHADDYAAVRRALAMSASAITSGDGPDSPHDFPTEETALGGILATLTERMQLLRKLRTWRERRRKR